MAITNVFEHEIKTPLKTERNETASSIICHVILAGDPRIPFAFSFPVYEADLIIGRLLCCFQLARN